MLCSLSRIVRVAMKRDSDIIDGADFAKRLRLDNADQERKRDENVSAALRESPTLPVATASTAAALRQYVARGNFIDRSGMD